MSSAVETIVHQLNPEAVDPAFTAVFTDEPQDYCLFYAVSLEGDLIRDEDNDWGDDSYVDSEESGVQFIQLYPVRLDTLLGEEDPEADVRQVPGRAMEKALTYMEAARRHFFGDKYEPSTMFAYGPYPLPEEDDVEEWEGSEFYWNFDFELNVPAEELEAYLGQFNFTVYSVDEDEAV
jgi:hypothetical protein